MTAADGSGFDPVLILDFPLRQGKSPMPTTYTLFAGNGGGDRESNTGERRMDERLPESKG